MTTFTICGGAWLVEARENGTDFLQVLAIRNPAGSDVTTLNDWALSSDTSTHATEVMSYLQWASMYFDDVIDDIQLSLTALEADNPTAYHDYIAPLFVTPNGRTAGEW